MSQRLVGSRSISRLASQWQRLGANARSPVPVSAASTQVDRDAGTYQVGLMAVTNGRIRRQDGYADNAQESLSAA
jgi:hypothetical protein